MILRLLRWWGARRPYFNILGADGSLYMGRWWLFGGSDEKRDEDDRRPAGMTRLWCRGWLDAMIGRVVAARLHHIAREDRARDLHSHPFDFVSIIVGGWYIERLPLDQDQNPLLDLTCYREIVREPGSVAYRRATDRHTIVAVSPGGAWTVCVVGRHKNRWGFHTAAGFVHPRNYGTMP